VQRETGNVSTRITFSKVWTIVGYLLACGVALFVGRIVYEETVLTWTNGPQMVGFAMMHGAVPFVLIAGIVALPCSLLWLLISAGLLIRKKFRTPFADWVPIILLVTLFGLLIVPYEMWEEFDIAVAGPGTHGSEFMVQAAANGNLHFVKRLLAAGYDVNYESSGGTTVLSGACVGGKVRMAEFLISSGANMNRKNHLSGETPIMAASEMGQAEAVKLLLRRGADPCATDKDGHTAAVLAKKYAHPKIAEYLSSQFRCDEHVIDPCADASVSVCVHP
jgi:hypothetical protein